MTISGRGDGISPGVPIEKGWFTIVNLLNVWLMRLPFVALIYLLSVAIVTSSSITSESKGDANGSRAAFLEAYKVLQHPRCVNCHPAGDAPLQGEDSRPHTFFRLRRGVDGQGVFAVKCGNCHQAQNQPGLHMPPGASYLFKEGSEDEIHRGEPRWRMPPAATPMIFEKRTPAQLCKQLLDKNQNGGLTPEQLVDHVSHDPLVLWGWNPGEGRSIPPLSHAEFVQKFAEWVNKGAACPR